jgi:hypothetical protein
MTLCLEAPPRRIPVAFSPLHLPKPLYPIEVEYFAEGAQEGVLHYYDFARGEHPDWRHAEEALMWLDRLDWQTAAASGTLAAFEHYRLLHPGGNLR